ncbi:hypothetical protein D3C72_2371700 [compost metagenome]
MDWPAFLLELAFRPPRAFTLGLMPDFFCSSALPGRFDRASAAFSAFNTLRGAVLAVPL